jgi:hypothetical protein
MAPRLELGGINAIVRESPKIVNGTSSGSSATNLYVSSISKSARSIGETSAINSSCSRTSTGTLSRSRSSLRISDSLHAMNLCESARQIRRAMAGEKEPRRLRQRHPSQRPRELESDQCPQLVAEDRKRLAEGTPASPPPTAA